MSVLFGAHRAITATALAVGLSLFASGAQAAVVNFGSGGGTGNTPYTEGDYIFEPGANRNNSGNCAAGACMLLNSGNNMMSTMRRVDDNPFTLNSIYYFLNAGNGQGQGAATLKVTPFSGLVAGTPVSISSPIQTGSTYNSFGPGFEGITSVKFEHMENAGNATIRVDDINVVPEIDAAAGVGSLAALGAMLAFARTRRRHVA